MTECTKPDANLQLKFDFEIGKPVIGAFDGGLISTDGGLGLLRFADDALKLTEFASICIKEKRRPDVLKHSLQDLLRQRIYAIAAGYEDANDASSLRYDPMHKLVLGRATSDRNLASQPTISRLENSVTSEELSFLQDLLVHTYIKKHKKPPKKLVLDLDTTCDPVHGYQQLSFYNAFYSTFCYIPMFVFDQHGYPLASLLRPGNADVGGDAARVLRNLFKILRSTWKNVPIEFRADAAFCRREVYQVCEEFKVVYFIGLKSNHNLRCLAKDLSDSTKHEFESIYGVLPQQDKTAWRRKQEKMRFSSKAEGRVQEIKESEAYIRKVGELAWRGRGYTHDMRVICRADYSEDGLDLRFVVTNHSGGNPRWLYETKYCRRGQCENWIKELKMVEVDRLSCQEFNANQFRLLEYTFAYILLRELRERLSKNESRISIQTFVLQFIKIGVLVRESVRRISLHWTSAYPRQQSFAALNLGFI
ncbi:MAG: IS1380 family transposase [Candidatus Melainabacteria bacterium]|nr:MAG: IS1380 family transposase [Candidatus Melainabacteria bacterium]QQR55864.1 MAG: IS1380 family transposase [Candidatus Melainabacteria bacterium]